MSVTKNIFFLLILSVGLCACKAFKPSADMAHYSDFFVDQSRNNTIDFFENSSTSLPLEGDLEGGTSQKKNFQRSLKDSSKLKVTFFGTSTLLFDDGETQIMVDAFLSRPPTLKAAFGKVRSNEKVINELIEAHSIKRLKGIFVCHSHYDHAMDAPALSKITGAKIHGSSSTLNIGKGSNVADSMMQLFVPGNEIVIGDFTITVLTSKHTPPFKILGKSNATNPNHPDITEPLKLPAKTKHFIEGGTFDVYIAHKGKRFLVKPSTNFIDNALNNYPCDVIFLGAAMLGILPVDFQQQYYAQTVKATAAKIIVPVHWDNFSKPLSQPLIALPNIADNVDTGFKFLIEKSKADGVEMKLLQGGSSIVF